MTGVERIEAWGRTRNGWTGGQYSLFRMLFGAYLAVHFAALVPYGAELFSSAGMLPEPAASPLYGVLPNAIGWIGSAVGVELVLMGSAGAAVAFAFGFWDRTAAAVIWYVLACLFARNPLISNPSLPYVGWLLLAHIALPREPLGSWDGRGKPIHAWSMPAGIHAAAWIVMVVGYSYSGYMKLISPSWGDGSALAEVLANPLARPSWLREALLALPDSMLCLASYAALALELFAAPLALFPQIRRWLWLGLLAMHLGLLVVLDFADLTLGMVMLHAFTFDPAWIPGTRGVWAGSTPLGDGLRGARTWCELDRVYFDADCGMCQGIVRFLLSEDAVAGRLRFAPLRGDTFQSCLPESVRSSLPDSLVVQTAEGTVLTRSEALLYLLGVLGGVWRLSALVAKGLPRRLRDHVYDLIARGRRRSEAGICPLLPAELSLRFDR